MRPFAVALTGVYASTVIDPDAHNLTMSGLSVLPALVESSAVGICTITNTSNGIFGSLAAASDSFGAVVIDGNGIVVATPSSWGPVGSFLGIPSGYAATNPGQPVGLSASDFRGIALATTPIPSSYAGQTLTFVVSPWRFAQGATVGAEEPFSPSAWLSTTFVPQALSLGVPPGVTPPDQVPPPQPNPIGGGGTGGSGGSGSGGSGGTGGGGSGGSGGSGGTGGGGGGTTGTTPPPSPPTTGFLGLNGQQLALAGAAAGAVVLGAVLLSSGPKQPTEYAE